MLRWFSNLKIAHKLILGFGLVLLLMLGTLATDAVVSTEQTSVADHLVNHLYPARQAAREIVTLARAADSDAGRYLLELDDQSRAATDLRTYEQEVQQIRQALAKANALADTNGQRQNIQAFTTFYQNAARGPLASATGMNSRSPAGGIHGRLLCSHAL